MDLRDDPWCGFLLFPCYWFINSLLHLNRSLAPESCYTGWNLQLIRANLSAISQTHLSMSETRRKILFSAMFSGLNGHKPFKGIKNVVFVLTFHTKVNMWASFSEKSTKTNAHTHTHICTSHTHTHTKPHEHTHSQTHTHIHTHRWSDCTMFRDLKMKHIFPIQNDVRVVQLVPEYLATQMNVCILGQSSPLDPSLFYQPIS